VTRQYCGQLGKQENCRVAVSLSLATEQASLPVAYQLYLPESWAQERHDEAGGVPEEIRFQTKPEIALDQIRGLVEEEVPRAPVLADAAYGNDTGFRDGLQQLKLEYAWACSLRLRSGAGLRSAPFQGSRRHGTSAQAAPAG